MKMHVNVPDNLYREIGRIADDEHRTKHSLVIHLIHSGLKSYRANRKAKRNERGKG